MFHSELSNSWVLLPNIKDFLVATSAGTNVPRSHLDFAWMRHLVRFSSMKISLFLPVM